MAYPKRQKLRHATRGPIGLFLVCAMTMFLAAPTIARPAAADPVKVSTSQVRGSDGKTYTATNHIVPGDWSAGRGHRSPHEWLLAWAGSVSPQYPDFIAVIDATKGAPTYGKVVNTVTLGPQTQNEPHHMQYMWHKGNQIFAGGLFSDTLFVLDPTHLPGLSLRGINLPMDTACGTLPDAFQVLKDGSAYVTEMGGPNVTGPCTYSNGQVRYGNGYAGAPGEVVHVSATGKTLAEAPAAIPGGEDPANCHDDPSLPEPTCANPHGVAVRQDLKRMVTSDFTQVALPAPGHPSEVAKQSAKTLKSSAAAGYDPYILRDTVRIWDISHENNPKVVSVSVLPVGPRPVPDQVYNENRVLMESATPNGAHHRGAFVASMFGGAVFYTPDITKRHPKWREILDDEAAYRKFAPDGSISSIGDGGSWLQVSPDDRFLYHVVLGDQVAGPAGVARGMIYVLDIRKLLAVGDRTRCSITTIDETIHGGTAPDCPAVVSSTPILDNTTGGPHWGAMNNLVLGHDGYYHETTHVRQVAVADYFVNTLGIDGNHKVCMFDQTPAGVMSLDTTFKDETTGTPCVEFNRQNWPHGPAGPARPHGVLYVAADNDVR